MSDPEHEKTPAQEKSATLSPAEFGELLKDMERRGDWGEYKRDIIIPQLDSKDTYCLWHISKYEGGKLAAQVLLFDGTTMIADVRFWTEDKEDGERVWLSTHRLVRPEKKYRGIGFGSFALLSAEGLLRHLHKHDKAYPTVAEINASQPTVINLGARNGYEFTSQAEKDIVEYFWHELAEHKNDVTFQSEGVLPSFRMLKLKIPLAPHQDDVIADRVKLEQYLKADQAPDPAVVPSGKSMGFLTLKTTLDEFDSFPFLVIVHMRKTL